MQNLHFFAAARTSSALCGQVFIAGTAGAGAGFIAILVIMKTQNAMITKSMMVLMNSP